MPPPSSICRLVGQPDINYKIIIARATAVLTVSLIVKTTPMSFHQMAPTHTSPGVILGGATRLVVVLATIRAPSYLRKIIDSAHWMWPAA
jgi:hypothetical protein